MPARITRESMITSVMRTMELPQYTQEQFDSLYFAYKNGVVSLDEAFKEASPNGKHFIKTGTTIEEWDEKYANRT